MSGPKPSRATQRLGSRQRRAAKALARSELFDLIVSGYTHEQVAAKLGVHVRTVRREVSLAIAGHEGEAPARFVVLQQARLLKALRVVDCALEDGDLKAVGPLLKVVAELERYRGMGDRLASPPSGRALPALAAAPLALTDDRATRTENGA